MVEKKDVEFKETENKDVEEEEEISDFNLEALIVEGTDAIIERKIEYFDTDAQKTRKMKIYVQPLAHAEWERMARLTGKKSKKSIEELVCSKGLVEPDGMEIPLSAIRRMQKGVVSSAYEEIKIVSGQTNDRFEEKFIEKISDF